MIIDTSNALAAPGSSRGYACLSVACRSIAPPGCAAGGCPRRARRALRPPKCRHGVPPKALWPRGRLPPARREKGTASSRRGPWPAGPSGVGLPPPGSASSRRKRPLGVAAVGGGGRGSGTVSRHGVAGAPRWWRGWGSRLPVRPAGAPPLPHARGASPGRRASAARARFPATPPPRLSPRRDGRFAPEAGSACASAPRGRVPRRRPAGRRGVCPPLRALPPGCGRAAVRAPELPPRGRGPGEIGGARCVRRPFGLRCPRVPRPSPPRPPLRRPAPRPSRGSRLVLPAPPRPLPLRPPAAAGRRRRRRRRLLLPEGRRVVGGGRSVGRGAACARGSGGARGGRPRASASPPSRAPPRGLPRPLPRALRDATSDQTWRPAEFKHISQRRKRN